MSNKTNTQIPFDIDFTNMQQTNTKTQYKRALQRIQQQKKQNQIQSQNQENLQQLQQQNQNQQQNVQWQWLEDGNKWIDYIQSISQAIEQEFQTNQNAKAQVAIKSNKTNQDVIFEMDFIQMKQMNTATQYKRDIQRITQQTQQPTPQQYTEMYQWGWKDDGGFVPYEKSPNKDIDFAFQKQMPNIQLLFKQKQYEIDFTQMTQKNTQTSFIRQILRAMPPIPVGYLSVSGLKENVQHTLRFIDDSKLSKAIDVEDFDKTYNIAQQLEVLLTIGKKGLEIQGSKDNVLIAQDDITQLNQKILKQKSQDPISVKYPPFWKQNQQNFYDEHDLQQTSKEFQEVVKLIHQTAQNVQVHKVTVIQNKILFQKFQAEIQALALIYKKIPQIKRLFHGTRSAQPITISQSEIGFDDKFANPNGAYGKGIYFARDASYSYQSYAYNCGNNQKQMFLCDVIVGESQQVSGPVIKPNDNLTYSQQGIKKRYDSVNNGNGMYILFENGRAYPVFLITYT